MNVLHANWNTNAAGNLHLWGETSETPAAAKKLKRRSAKALQSRLHPFALEGAELKNAIAAVAGSLIAESGKSGKLKLHLPSIGEFPASSPQLIRDQDESPKMAKELKLWEVPTAKLEPGLALDFLLSLSNESAPDIALGDSIRFWAETAKFAIELIVQQRFFPWLLQEKANQVSYRASWTAYLSESDFDRLELLAKALPPVCRAAKSDDSDTPPAPMKLLMDFLNRVIDHYIRGQLQSADLRWQSAKNRQQKQSAAEEWLRALSSEDSILHISTKEADAFAQKLDSWLQQIRPSPTVAPFRVCFRLEPPDAEKPKNEPWTIRYYLQANDDRSLLIPAAKVWARASDTLTFLQRKFENPQERLLADLAKAARLFPTIETSLRTARPSGLHLDTQQAYHFLRQAAALLEQSGFGVLLPAWWQKPVIRLGVKLQVHPKSTTSSTGESILGLDGILSYNWQVALGEETLSAAEFEKLANLKVPLVKVRGQWVELRPEEIEKAIAFFKKQHADGEMSLGEALRIGLGGDATETGLKVTGVEAAGWISDVLNQFQNETKIELLASPPNFCGQLRPYQLTGFSWLAFLKQFGLGACLADDMGLGKTIQFIALILHAGKGRKKQRPSLIICPTSVVGNWQKEIQRFAPSLRVMIHHGAERLSGKSFAKQAQRHDMVISTYALVHRDQWSLSQFAWSCLVLDEAQNIKNSAAKQTQAVRQLNADFRVALTGTPVENRLSELWSIMEFLNPGYLGSATDFRSKFAIPIERYRNSERAQALKSLIRPFVLRRLKTDTAIIQDLPEKNEMKMYCSLTAEQASLYEAVVKEMLEKIAHSEGITRKGLVLATLSKLKQICNHPAHFLQDGSELADRSGKLIRLREMLEEVLAENDRALVFTQFKEMGSLLRHDLQRTLGTEALFLHGGTPQKQRDEMVQRFHSADGPPLFILSLKAGGVGLNLTAANHVFHFDRWWNPAVENQATDRAFRIGQRKNVQVYKFLCLGTMEERIDQMIEMKKELVENVIGTGESWLTELTTEELRELFSLSRQAIAEE